MSKVLIACEFSGIVRDAFIARGIDAVSCDLLPSERPGPHIQGDIRYVLDYPWGLMIAHPPCTYLANSGNRWLWKKNEEGKNDPVPERWDNMREGADFFRLLLDADIPLRCIENPIMHRYGKEVVGRSYDQLVQPWMFGHPEQKATCFWLNGLPPLVATNNVKSQLEGMTEGQRQPMFYASPGPDRWKLRSTTYQGIADAMADQWGSLLN